MVIALNNDKCGGITGLIISWVDALLGFSATPMLLKLIPAYKHCDSKAAISSIAVRFLSLVRIYSVCYYSKNQPINTEVECIIDAKLLKNIVTQSNIPDIGNLIIVLDGNQRVTILVFQYFLVIQLLSQFYIIY